MKRLSHAVFWTLALAVVVAVVVTGLIARAISERRVSDVVSLWTRAEARRVAPLLPPAGAPVEELQRALAGAARDCELQFAVLDADGAVVAAAPDLPAHGRPSHRRALEAHASGPLHRLELGDGRALVVRPSTAHLLRTSLRALGGVLAVLGTLLLASHLVSRRITRRLEKLDAAVAGFGTGDLAARVQEHGSDEVASLARRFNWAASRIEELVQAQRRVLANTSHELRSPLARLRVALELLGSAEIAGARHAELLDEGIANIAELDALVDELLLHSRLQAGPRETPLEAVDLRALLVDEARQAGVRCELPAGDVDAAVRLVLPGDPRLLRRLVRNLLSNARRHGQAAQVELGAASVDDGVLLWVQDRGPGVAEADRARIFEPFYRPAGHAEGESGGVGLGLAIVEQIALRHGGTVACLARDGGGTRIEVRLSRPAGVA